MTEHKSFKIKSVGASDIELVRSNNEDVWTALPELGFFALADGMGGHRAGEVAAKVAIISLTQAIHNLLSSKKTYGPQELATLLKEAVQKTNKYIFQVAKENEELAGMGTTLCALLIYKNFAIYAHVGDSRIYRFQEKQGKQGKLERLTQDHSLRFQLIAKGELDEKAAQNFPYKNVITRAVGTSSEVEPDVAVDAIKTGDTFLLCSDGLTDVLTDENIEKIIKESPTIEKAADLLISTAKENGGYDNITVVIIQLCS